jgi:hypothetical protein
MTADTKTTDFRTLFGTNREAEENGKWFDYEGGVRVKLRRFKSKHATKTRERIEKPFAALRRNGLLPSDVMEKVLHQTLVESILVEWSGVALDGQDLLPTQENFDSVLLAYPEFRDRVTADAIALDGFRDESDKDTEKN